MKKKKYQFEILSSAIQNKKKNIKKFKIWIVLFEFKLNIYAIWVIDGSGYTR